MNPPIPENHEALIRMEAVSKSFGALLANDRVSMEIRSGEIHALLGENGAGKSTLMSILAGRYRPDSGTIRFEGRPVQFNSPAQSLAAGIGMVYQNLMLVEPLTVAENVILGTGGQGLRLRLEEAESAVRELGKAYGLEVEPTRKIRSLSMGERQRVEILKLLFRRARVLIFDEPTAILSPPEIERFFETLAKLAADGHPIVFITHKLEEVMRTAQRITIMRRGRVTATFQPQEIRSRRTLARLMVGREVVLNVDKPPLVAGSPVLELQRVSAAAVRGLQAFSDVSLQVRRGEIVALTGVAGNGQSELAAAVAGLAPMSRGSIFYAGADFPARIWHQTPRPGLVYIPEDRQRVGSMAAMDLGSNYLLTHTDRFSRRGWLHSGRARAAARRALTAYGVDLALGLHRPAGTLSGGNLQKLILAREFDHSPGMIVAEQPTQGLDVGATEDVWQALLRRRESAGILLISSDLREVLSLADRIAVMFRGRILDTISTDDPEQISRIGLLMAGVEE